MAWYRNRNACCSLVETESDENEEKSISISILLHSDKYVRKMQ